MKAIKQGICFILAMFLTLSMMIPTASAEGYIPITARITFEGRYSRALRNINNEYQIRIVPFNSAPLPSNNIITIPPRSKGQFDIIIDDPGTYVYRVYQIKGDDPRVFYDDTIYLVKVFVENTEDLATLRYAVTLTVAASEAKPSEISFQNIPSGSIPPHPDPDPDDPDPHTDTDLPSPPSPPGPPSPPVTDTPPEPVVPVTNNDSPVEDHSAGAGIEGEGILIDVGTVVTKIAVASGAAKNDPKSLEEFENSFVGSIPVIYIIAVLITLIAVFLVFSPAKRKDEENNEHDL